MTTAANLEALHQQAWDLATARVGKGKPEARAAADRRIRATEIRTQIEGLVARAPFETKDNGVHEYVETPKYLVFRNHGSPYWQVLLRTSGGGLAPLGREEKAKSGAATFACFQSIDAKEALSAAISAAA